MAPVAGDLAFYPSLSSPLSDTAAAGGGIDTASRLMTAILTTREKLEALSSSAADITQRVTIRGISFGGLVGIDVLRLNGTTVVKGLVEFRRVLEISLSASCAGTVSVRRQSDNVAIRTIATGITKYTTLFKYAYPLEQAALARYEKCFVKNNHGADSLPKVSLALVDASGLLTVGLAGSLNDSLSVANRRTAPSGITFSASSTYVNGSDLTAGAAQGVWLKQTLSVNHRIVEASSNFTVHVFGS